MNQKGANIYVEAAPEEVQGIGRHMSLLSGVALITGFIIGSGIFAAPGSVLVNSGSLGLALILWVGAGLISTIGALAYCELGTLFPQNGADHVYLGEAFHPILGLGFSINNVLMASPCLEAAMASVFGEYMVKLIQWDSTKEPTEQPAISEDNWTPRAIGVVGIITVACANMVHKKAGTSIQTVFTGGKLLALVFIIIVGIVYLAKGEQSSFLPGENVFAKTSTDIEKIINAILLSLFGYIGYNTLNAAAGELKNPGRNLPLSVIFSMLITTILYLLVNVAYFAVLGGPTVAKEKGVAMLVGAKVMQMTGAVLMAVGVILSTLGAQNACAIAHSRVIMSAAEEGIWMPRILAKISSRGTPIYAFLLNILLTCTFLICFKDFAVLGSVSCFCFMTYHMLSNAACIWLRRKLPDTERAFKVPIILPFIFTIVAAAINIITLVYCDSQAKAVGYGCALASGFVVPAIVYYFRADRVIQERDSTLHNPR